MGIIKHTLQVCYQTIRSCVVIFLNTSLCLYTSYISHLLIRLFCLFIPNTNIMFWPYFSLILHLKDHYTYNRCPTEF